MATLNLHRQQTGMVLLMLAVLMALGGFAVAQTYASSHFKEQIRLQQFARQSQLLDHIRTSLLGFAGQQGVHSQSHIGHLPCPALQPETFAQTSCLQKPWGYLPVRSKTASNYLNIGIDARNNELEPSVRQDWHYAVSAQLIQANAMGWSRWVDFSKPSIQFRVPAENNRKVTGVVAVVAHAIQPVAEHHYDITPPYIFISENELIEHIRRTQHRLLADTLNNWQANLGAHHQTMQIPNVNLEVVSGKNDVFKPVDSNCSCRCTQTRCTCKCDSSTNWVFNEIGPACTSTDEQACILPGPTQLQTRWPISRFEPVAALNKSCRPTSRHECPLSTGNQPCICDFSWPDNTKNDLHRFLIAQGQQGQFQIRQAP